MLSSGLKSFWESHKEEFQKWLLHRNVSRHTKQNYISALTRFFESRDVHKPNDIRKFQLKDKESRGLRNLFNYCEDEEIEDVAGHSIEKWRRFIIIQKSGAMEVYVTDEEMKQAYESCPETVKPVYELLMYSGSRFSHIHQMLKNFDECNIIIDGEVAHYPTSSFSEGTKRTFHVFFPTSFVSKLKSIGKPYSYYYYTKHINHNRVCSKTIRKWHLNLMIREGIIESLLTS